MNHDIVATLGWIDSAIPGFATEFERYREPVPSAAVHDGLSEMQRALVRLALAMTIPDAQLTARALAEARGVATEDDIKHAACIATGMRAGAAVAYGRLAFKMIEGEPVSPNVASVEQIRLDREYMTQLRKGSPQEFDQLVKVLGLSHRPGLALSPLTQELISIGCSAVTQCVYCMEKHAKDAKRHGATMGQISQVVHLAIVVRMESTLLGAAQLALPD